jgi:hypothetical protein
MDHLHYKSCAGWVPWMLTEEYECVGAVLNVITGGGGGDQWEGL